MQTKSKQKPQKVLQGFSSGIDQVIDFSPNKKIEEFIEHGAICNDGTYTHVNGRGAGTRHNGVKYKLYAKKSDFDITQIALSSKASLQTNGSSHLTSKSQNSEQKEVQNIILASKNSKKKTQGKIKLKDLFKTKAKKLELFDKVHLIFEKSFKDLLEFSHEQITDDIWLLFSSISAIYDDLQQANQVIKQLQSVLPAQKVSNFQVKDEQRRISNEVEAFLRPDIDTLRKQNKELNKQILKISKENTKLQENLNIFKLKDKNLKKMLKIIERSDPKLLNTALEKSEIDIKDLKSPKEQESRVVTRSTARKNQKKQQKMNESLFSSDDDSSDFYDKDETIRNIIRQLK